MDNRKILDEVYRDFFGTVKEEKIITNINGNYWKGTKRSTGETQRLG